VSSPIGSVSRDDSLNMSGRRAVVERYENAAFHVPHGLDVGIDDNGNLLAIKLPGEKLSDCLGRTLR
jgi:hypothetical protein